MTTFHATGASAGTKNSSNAFSIALTIAASPNSTSVGNITRASPTASDEW